MYYVLCTYLTHVHILHACYTNINTEQVAVNGHTMCVCMYVRMSVCPVEPLHW